jgi:hypothetical protein
MPAKGKPTKLNRKASREQKRAQRRSRVWNLFMAGTPKSTIAAIVDCAPQTVTNDIEETTQELQEMEPLYAEDIKERAIRDRRHIKRLALEASAAAEPKDRATSLKVATENQGAIEDLEGLHPDEPVVLPVVPIVLQIGSDSEQHPALGDASDDELAEAAAKIKAEQAALPAPVAEEPAAEYTPVEEPAESPDESAS